METTQLKNTPDRDAPEVWKILHPCGHFIELNGTDEDNQEVIIKHSSGSHITMRTDGNVEIHASNDLILYATESLIAKCKRFVLESEGGEAHRSDYHNHILFNGDLDIEVSGKVQSSLNKDVLTRIGGKNNLHASDIVNIATGTLANYCAHMKNGTNERPINSQVNVIESILNYVEGEMCAKTNREDGNISLRTPGRANINVGEDMITNIDEKDTKTVGGKAKHRYKDELLVIVDKDRKEINKKNYTIEVREHFNLISNSLSLNILSGATEIKSIGSLNLITSQIMDISAGIMMVIKSPSIDFNNSPTPVGNLPQFTEDSNLEENEPDFI